MPFFPIKHLGEGVGGLIAEPRSEAGTQGGFAPWELAACPLSEQPWFQALCVTVASLMGVPARVCREEISIRVGELRKSRSFSSRLHHPVH